MQGIIQFIRLGYSCRGDRVHNLWYLGWVECAVRVVTCSSTHSKTEILRCRGEAACLVWTKAILAGQRHCKAPTRSWLSTKGGGWHAEGDEARDGISADSNCAHCVVMCVNVTLSKPLYLDKPVPSCARVNRVIALWEGRSRRGIT